MQASHVKEQIKSNSQTVCFLGFKAASNALTFVQLSQVRGAPSLSSMRVAEKVAACDCQTFDVQVDCEPGAAVAVGGQTAEQTGVGRHRL